jgi:hypothetical protein
VSQSEKRLTIATITTSDAYRKKIIGRLGQERAIGGIGDFAAIASKRSRDTKKRNQQYKKTEASHCNNDDGWIVMME